jgi:hypothetical protein
VLHKSGDGVTQLENKDLVIVEITLPLRDDLRLMCPMGGDMLPQTIARAQPGVHQHGKHFGCGQTYRPTYSHLFLQQVFAAHVPAVRLRDRARGLKIG